MRKTTNHRRIYSAFLICLFLCLFLPFISTLFINKYGLNSNGNSSVFAGSRLRTTYKKKESKKKKDPGSVTVKHTLTTKELLETYNRAIRSKVLIPTYDPFLDVLGVLAWGYNKDPRELYITQATLNYLLRKISKPTLFTGFMQRFERITLTTDKRIITEMTTRAVNLEIPKAFGCKIEIQSGFVLTVARKPGNKTVVTVRTPKKTHFRFHGTMVSKVKGVIDMDIRQLTLVPEKNVVNKPELIAYIDGNVPLYPLGNATKKQSSRYKEYRVQVNLSTLGTIPGASFVRGYYLDRKDNLR
jgi:hypothetical protein